MNTPTFVIMEQSDDVSDNNFEPQNVLFGPLIIIKFRNIISDVFHDGEGGLRKNIINCFIQHF